jgi:hypothetical protein
MSAAQALQVARSAGIKVRIEGDDLLLEAAGPPPAALLDLLSHNKKGILAILRPGRDGWSAEDWHVFFDERASIAEFDGGVPRSDAEARAFACLHCGMAEPQSGAFAARTVPRLRRS